MILLNKFICYEPIKIIFDGEYIDITHNNINVGVYYCEFFLDKCGMMFRAFNMKGYNNIGRWGSINRFFDKKKSRIIISGHTYFICKDGAVYGYGQYINKTRRINRVKPMLYINCE